MSINYDGQVIRMTAQGDSWPKEINSSGNGGPITIETITFHGATTSSDGAVIKAKADGSGQEIANLTADGSGDTEVVDAACMDVFLGMKLTTLDSGSVTIYVK